MRLARVAALTASVSAIAAPPQRVARKSCFVATEWEPAPEGIERSEWETCDGSERLAVKLALSWAGTLSSAWAGPQGPPPDRPRPPAADLLRPVSWTAAELKALASPAVAKRAARERRPGR